jgi:hypothetical protein
MMKKGSSDTRLEHIFDVSICDLDEQKTLEELCSFRYIKAGADANGKRVQKFHNATSLNISTNNGAKYILQKRALP